MKATLLAIVGPTASGKTALAAALAAKVGGEVISGDSRQVYRRMNIGTGKDLSDYRVGDCRVPLHLVDICEPGEKYTVFHYRRDFFPVYDDIRARGRLPILCGGSGLYMEAILRNYRLPDVPPNPALREALEGKTLDELAGLLAAYQPLHNTTDLDTPQRAVRAIEIAAYQAAHPEAEVEGRPLHSLVLGLDPPRELRRKRISERLRARLDEGLLNEVRALLNEGISPEDLIYYGLEYKYVTLHLTGQLSYEEMFTQLETAIHQFAKRQMTWFRGMERRGCCIHWIDFGLPLEKKIEEAIRVMSYEL
ncbi:MAG: tRNA (adenosine(37)-N6)-dimethylallyltransferase MiaA [Tannerella sp.]|jgi:tRNA dimethylallyltransferase|nr:tRNA (adenosine(37)-N6)-dimethylallyltransferase MiaA [Tannerella sp.]